MEEGEKKLYTDPVTGEQISKKELKKREKMRKKQEEQEKKKKEKEAKGAKAQEGEGNKPKKNKDDDEVDPTKYFENRKAFLLKEIEAGKNPFPHKFNVTIGLPEFIQKYKDITKKGEFLDEVVQVAGRVHSIRKSGASLIFYDIKSNDAKIQIYVNRKNHKGQKSFEETHNNIRRGDFILGELIQKIKKGNSVFRPLMSYNYHTVFICCQKRKVDLKKPKLDSDKDIWTF